MSRGASPGLRNWFLQRLSAVYIVLFLAVFVVVWGGEAASYSVWRQWVSHPLANVALMLFIGSLLIHAWIGIRDVILDYIHPVGVRYVLLVLIGIAMWGQALWALKVLLQAGMS